MRTIICVLVIFGVTACNIQDYTIPENFDYGTLENGLYKNDFFGLEARIDTTWVVQNNDQTAQLLKKGSEVMAEGERMLEVAKITTANLLTIFKYDADAGVESNPSLMILAENTKHALVIETGADYLVFVKKNLANSQIGYDFERKVFEKTIGKRKFHVLEAKLNTGNLIVTQEYIATVMKGFSLLFTITYTNEAERQELYEMLNQIKV